MKDRQKGRDRVGVDRVSERQSVGETEWGRDRVGGRQSRG